MAWALFLVNATLTLLAFVAWFVLVATLMMGP